MKTIKEGYNLIPTSGVSDQDKPLSFQIWKKSFEVILPDQAYTQYNDYLIAWYKNKKQNNNDPLIETKLNFLNLLKQIQIFFTAEEKENWYSGIDVDNEKEVLLAIPYFARKLKNISLYYLQLREKVKSTKLKYNLAGSNKSVVKQIQDIILQNYTKKDDAVISLPSTLWAHIPELSAIKKNFVIEIEELHDTSSYFDRSTNLPPSAYFTFDDETEKYFLTKGLNLSSIDWVYRLGTFTASALNINNSLETTDTDLSSLTFELAQKYLGNNFYSSLVTTASAKKDFYTVNISQGNNFFFYPNSPYKINVTGLPRYKPTPLSATNLQTLGTPGSSLELADTIFIKTKNGIEGAWFRKKTTDTGNINMQAVIEGNTSTVFRFPFPGFGLSAEDIEWTGYQTVTDPRFFYLDENTKRAIERVYWNSSFALSGITPLSINSTSLVNNGAYPSNDFNAADKIRIWPTPPLFESQRYSDIVKEAWLYKFLNTNISIGGNTDNTIVWPFQKVFDVEKDSTTSLPDYPYNVCLPTLISDLPLPFATGGAHISSADVIYKINNFKDTKDQAIECAWLSAENYYYPDIHTYGPKQTHFSTIFTPGTFTSFVWDSNDKVDINTVINGSTLHAPDCKFLTTPNTTYRDHKLCTCKLVNFAPFGHPGADFNEYSGLCDYVVEDTGYKPEVGFNLSNWKDQTNTGFAESSAACWFKTNQKIGWGNGTWYSGNTETGNIFLFRKGKRYLYYRANIKDQDPEVENFPEIITRQINSANNSINRTWINAVKNEDGEWVSTNTPSTMSINSNDILIYSRTGTTYFNITGNTVENQTIAENRGSIWSSFDYISVNNPSSYIILSYPTQTLIPRLTGDEYKQYPELQFENVTRIASWEITNPLNSVQTFINQDAISFIPSLTGLYTVRVTAITAIPATPFFITLLTAATAVPTFIQNTQISGIYIFTDIPPITCIPNTTNVQTVSTFNTPIPGYVLTTNLKGWNYTTNSRTTLKATITGENIGAIPLWIKSNIDKTPSTDFKTTESWSPSLSFVDEYNPVNFYEISDIILKGGEYLEYKRKPQSRITWNENITLNNTTDINEWCDLKFNTNNFQPFIGSNINLISDPTTTPTKLLLQNVVENEPVEVYYNALSSFTWIITAEPQISETVFSSLVSSIAVTSKEPWANLTNQFYPTIAVLPAFDKLYSTKELGEYFKPTNLGLLTYVNKDYTFETNLSALSTTNSFNAPYTKINNRGLTKEYQFSPYTLTQNDNTWLKEPYTTGSLAGTIKKNIFKKYQKFIPYQSTYESNPQTRFGLITPVSRQHPWTGSQDTEWADLTNRPINFTGEINVSHWIKDQVLKNTTLQLDNWCTDIFGNQYGLYKNIKNTTPSQRTTIPGQIWIRKNSQQTEPGYTALLDVFDTYKTISLYNELTGLGVNKIDIFYNTLLIETSAAVLFEKINYDYSSSGVFSIADSARAISLIVPTQNNLNRELTNTLPNTIQIAKVGDTWFFAKEQIVIISVVELQNSIPVPSLYSLDLSKNILKKAFAISATSQTLSGLDITEVFRPTLSYCSTKKQFLLSFVSKKTNSENILISLYINNTSEFLLDNVKIYLPQQQESLPPAILSNLNVTLPVSSSFTQLIATTPNNCNFEPIDFPSWANLSQTGLFTCLTPEIRQMYNLSFKVTNNVGPTYSSLNITVV